MVDDSDARNFKSSGALCSGFHEGTSPKTVNAFSSKVGRSVCPILCVPLRLAAMPVGGNGITMLILEPGHGSAR